MRSRSGIFEVLGPQLEQLSESRLPCAPLEPSSFLLPCQESPSLSTAPALVVLLHANTAMWCAGMKVKVSEIGMGIGPAACDERGTGALVGR